MNKFAQTVQNAAAQLQELAGEKIQHAVVLGTGLSGAVEKGEGRSILFSDIEGMQNTSALSHAGKISFQDGSSGKIAFCHGRLHLYEGFTPQQVTLLIYALRLAGAESLILTNAAGALNPDFTPGDIMVITDHINATGQNPVVGQHDELGSRFTDMSNAYDATMVKETIKLGHAMNLPLQRGIYAGVLGPTLETRAERRMLRSWGADAVGMSTVMETIAANHCGLKVLGLSAITNRATGEMDQQPDSIEAILSHAESAGVGIRKIIYALF